MPRHWVPRTLEPLLKNAVSPLKEFPVWLLLGPRQVGKSSLLSYCSQKQKRTYVNLDHLNIRMQATQDPEIFFKNLTPPLLIDEIQYAPKLLSPIKRLADAHPQTPGIVWITGSQNFQVMKNVHESLAGRVALLNLFGLSDEEKKLKPNLSAKTYFKHMLNTSFPKMFFFKNQSTKDMYLSSYLQTYVERDIRELMRIEKRRAFEIFVKMCALRTGQVINRDSLSKEVGVSATTISDWLSVLEDGFLIRLVPPYFSNRNKRLIKSPKLYFLDTGLAAYLAGWQDPEMARLGPMGGALFETHVFSNLVRFFSHRAQNANIFFWRTRDQQEIDFLVQYSGHVFPIEVKMGTPSSKNLLSLSKIKEPNWKQGTVISLSAVALSATTQKNLIHQDWNLLHPNALFANPKEGEKFFSISK